MLIRPRQMPPALITKWPRPRPGRRWDSPLRARVRGGPGLALGGGAQTLGVKVRGGGCAHYPPVTEGDMTRLGAVGRCARPLRARSTQDSLWQYLKACQITAIGSDHSPAPPE